MTRAIVLLLVTALALGLETRAASARETADTVKRALSAYLRREAARIMVEGDRVERSADRMRSEALRLNKESGVLRNQALFLDTLWDGARRVNPVKYVDYEGRDRSQQRMRADAEREDQDANQLREEGRRLDDEAIRLWGLSAAVDPERHLDWLERIKKCCSRKSGIDLLRSKIAEMARALDLKYTPH